MNSNRGELLKEILAGIGVLGLVIITGAMAPNIFSALGRVGFSRKKYNSNFKKTFYYAKRGNLIVTKEKPDGSIELVLSKKGKKKVLEYDLEKLKINPMKKWDGRWRFVIFDIPNKFKNRANFFRNKLKDLGLYQFQKSVWLHPYHLENEIDFIARVSEVRPFIKLGVITKLESEHKIKNFFQLK